MTSIRFLFNSVGCVTSGAAATVAAMTSAHSCILIEKLLSIKFISMLRQRLNEKDIKNKNVYFSCYKSGGIRWRGILRNAVSE